MQITNIDSTAIASINVVDNVAEIEYKGSGKTYSYTINDTNFVNNLQNVIENNQSVGRFVNKSIREDQTLQIVAV